MLPTVFLKTLCSKVLATFANHCCLLCFSIDERDGDRFISRTLVCRSSDSSYNSTDSSLVTVGYRLRFLALLGTRSADLACMWYYYVIPCNRY